MILYAQLLAIAIMTSLSCAFLGNFLVLRGVSFISDALGHAILFGIVLSFFIIHDTHHPFMFVGATFIGMITILAIEWLINTKKIYPDSAISLVFPLLFALATMLIHQHAQYIHLDTDAIFLGELSFAPFKQWYIKDYPMGPIALWIMSFFFLLNSSVIIATWRSCKVSSFDPDYAQFIGFKPQLNYYVIMMLTCLTIVAAFECAGSILVVSFIIAPAAAAYLISKQLYEMIIISFLYAVIGCITGAILAHLCNISYAGSIAVCNGLCFGITLLLKNYCSMLD